MSDDKLLAIASEELSPLNETERLVIALADAMADTPSNISDDLYTRLHAVFNSYSSIVAFLM